ncbi:MAG TPA: hypothetical protein PLZ86_04070 [bacterium]|nr:hypothetical protein [bacterium]
MKSRLLFAVCAIFFLAGCAALDSDNTPYEGMMPGDPIPGISPGAGQFSGYYEGKMTTEFNTCSSVSDETGSEFDLAIEVMHEGNLVEVSFEGSLFAGGTLDGSNVTVVLPEGDVKHVYHLTFAEEQTISGDIEVIEIDEAGQFGAPCAAYALALTKGIKPVDFNQPAPQPGSDRSGPGIDAPVATKFK